MRATSWRNNHAWGCVLQSVVTGAVPARPDEPRERGFGLARIRARGRSRYGSAMAVRGDQSTKKSPEEFGKKSRRATGSRRDNTAQLQSSPERGESLDTRLVDAGGLVTSHDDALRPNPAFPAELQPRDRSRAALETQIRGSRARSTRSAWPGGSCQRERRARRRDTSAVRSRQEGRRPPRPKWIVDRGAR